MKKSEFHVLGDMDLKKNQNSMYPGTLIQIKQNSIYRIHESEKENISCVAQGVEVARHNFFFFLAIFFNM
jgi:hypothetical protein